MMRIMDEDDLAERMSAMRRPGEAELDYYERRYQERVSLFGLFVCWGLTLLLNI